MGPQEAQAELCPGGREHPIHLHPWGPARKEEGDTHTDLWRSPQGAEHTQVHLIKKKEDTPDCWVQNQLVFTEASIEPWVLQLGRGLLGEDQAPARLCDLE